MEEISLRNEKIAENYSLLVHLAKSISYKPGYTFSIEHHDTDTALISLCCPNLPSCDNENDTACLIISNTVNLSSISVLRDALKAFTRVIADFELHEATEFLRLKGNQLFLPHADEKESGDLNWIDFRNVGGGRLNSEPLSNLDQNVSIDEL